MQVKINLKNGEPELIDSSGGGGGNVIGPASSIDNELARFDATTGRLIQGNSGISVDDFGNMNFPLCAHLQTIQQVSFCSDNGSYTACIYLDNFGVLYFYDEGGAFTYSLADLAAGGGGIPNCNTANAVCAFCVGCACCSMCVVCGCCTGGYLCSLTCGTVSFVTDVDFINQSYSTSSGICGLSCYTADAICSISTYCYDMCWVCCVGACCGTYLTGLY